MDYDPELDDNLAALAELADMGYLDIESASFGIAKLWFHEGEDALSSKQMFLFNRDVRPVISKMCGACGEDIELTALPNAYSEDKMLCSYHTVMSHVIWDESSRAN